MSETVYTVPAGPIGLIASYQFVDANNITITIPPDKLWEVDAIIILYACSATAGTRTPMISIKNQTDLTIWQKTTADLTASQVGYILCDNFVPDNITNIREQRIHFGMRWLPPRYKIVVQDTANISPADDIYVYIYGRQLSK